MDISENRSKSLKEFEGLEFDYVVTVCGGEGQACPFFSGGKTYFHEPFENASEIDGTDENKIDAFRITRDKIKERIEKTFKV